MKTEKRECSCSPDYSALTTNDQLSSDTIFRDTWEMIFNTIPDMVALIGTDCKLIKVNKAFSERMGINQDDFEGKLCYNVIHSSNHPLLNCPHQAVLTKNTGAVMEMYEPVLNGWFMVSTTPLQMQDGKLIGSLHILRDITDKKNTENKLREINRELNELISGREKFMSILAHDLRSPFQSLLGFTELMREEVEQNNLSNILQYISFLENSAKSTFNLLENVLEWLLLETGKMPFHPSSLDLKETVDTVVLLLNALIRQKEISIVTDIRTDRIWADAKMIKSMLLNLISNAIKFSYTGQTVEVTASKSEGQVCISIIDHGIGMQQEVVEKIFDQTQHITLAGTANEPGTGLGLMIVHEMIEKHNGTINIYSQPGKGSEFRICLPAHHS